MWRTSRSLPTRRAARGSLVAAVLLMALLVAVSSWTAPPARLGPSLEGPCRVQATVTGTDSLIDPSRSGGVYDVPVAGVVAYDAALSDSPADVGARRIAGRVELDLPPPFPSVRLATWDAIGRSPIERGRRAYRLPAAVAPIGATVTVRAVHQDAEARCVGSLSVRLAGGPFDNPVRVVTVLWTVVAAALVARSATDSARRGGGRRADAWLAAVARPGTPGTVEQAARSWWRPRGRPARGGVAGTAFGLGLAALVLLSGSVPLQSATLTVLVVLGALAGVVSGWIAPVGGAGRTGSGGPEEPEVTLLLADDTDPGSTSTSSTASTRAP